MFKIIIEICVNRPFYKKIVYLVIIRKFSCIKLVVEIYKFHLHCLFTFY